VVDGDDVAGESLARAVRDDGAVAVRGLGAVAGRLGVGENRDRVTADVDRHIDVRLDRVAAHHVLERGALQTLACLTDQRVRDGRSRAGGHRAGDAVRADRPVHLGDRDLLDRGGQLVLVGLDRNRGRDVDGRRCGVRVDVLLGRSDARTEHQQTTSDKRGLKSALCPGLH
jgi:hypothetical protein